jgi:hypothetical protein
LKPIDEKIVFSLIPGSDNDTAMPILILGVPRAAWDYMKGGKTHNFDFSSIGIPLQMMLYGADTHADAVKVIEDVAESKGIVLDDQRRKDFTAPWQKP